MLRVGQIKSTLDLAIRLTDTASGHPVPREYGSLEVTKNGRDIPFVYGSEGDVLFINSGREDCELSIKVRGYAPAVVRVRYGELDAALPFINLHLILDGKTPCFTLEGEMPGIAEIDAVKLEQPSISVTGYDQRKRILSISNPRKLALERLYYAVLDTEAERYDVFTVEKPVSDTSLKVSRPLDIKDIAARQPHITHRVLGMADGHSYTLRLRDDGGNNNWLVRFVTNSGETFRKVHFGERRRE